MSIEDIVDLSDMLAELGKVKRATKLPSGENESDSHHSFSLALIAYNICITSCPELDMTKLLLFGLAHDLLEIVTGDEDTLHYDQAALAAKQEREMQAVKQFDELFARFPALRGAVYEYEKLDTPEAATIFVLDKACTTWTHFHDNGAYARAVRNLHNKQDIANWADRQRAKMKTRLKVQPPPAILDVYEASFIQLQGLYDS